jgi:hypothetical protein
MTRIEKEKRNSNVAANDDKLRVLHCKKQKW